MCLHKKILFFLFFDILINLVPSSHFVHAFTTSTPTSQTWIYHNHYPDFQRNSDKEHAGHQKYPYYTHFLNMKEISASNADQAQGIRLNKVLKETHSRREADALIESGRITVNGKPVGVKGGFKVIPFVDTVELDGKLVRGWEKMNGFTTTKNNIDDQNNKRPSSLSTAATMRTQKYTNSHFEYIKYWKPKGVTSTTEKTIRSNIIHEIQRDGYSPKHRVYPVGRLDKDTTGLILLTSDGRLPNAVLRGEAKQPKIYEVSVDRPVTSRDVENLKRGVVITTVAMRDGKKAPPLTARTKPCEVQQISPKTLRITLIEGRNRQVRKMLAALNYDVIKLHRIRFMGMGLDPLKGPGDWKRLSNDEMMLVENALKNAALENNRNSS